MCRYTQSSNGSATNDTEQWYVHQHGDGAMACLQSTGPDWLTQGRSDWLPQMLSGPSGAVKSLDY